MDCMLDLETLGTKPGCAVVEVAAVAFEITTGEVMGEFVRKINPASCAERGLIAEVDTVEWHRRGGRMSDIVGYKEGLRDSLRAFSDWYGWHSFRRCWVKGAEFDFPILRVAYATVGEPFMEAHYSRLTCMRGVTSLAAQTGRLSPDQWVDPAHTGLEDCKQQVEDLVRALEALGVGGIAYAPMAPVADAFEGGVE